MPRSKVCKLLIIFGVLLFQIQFLQAQEKLFCTHSKLYDKYPLDSVSLFNKELDSSFALPFHAALSHYPELDSVQIVVKRKRIRTMMLSRPAPSFLFAPRHKRKYVILINNGKHWPADLLFEDMGCQAAIGIIGHELAHTLTYEKLSNLSLFLYGFKYLISRKKIEHETDIIVIDRGLGEELLEFNQFLENHEEIDHKYKKKKSKYYLSASEIERRIQDQL